MLRSMWPSLSFWDREFTNLVEATGMTRSRQRIEVVRAMGNGWTAGAQQGKKKRVEMQFAISCRSSAVAHSSIVVLGWKLWWLDYKPGRTWIVAASRAHNSKQRTSNSKLDTNSRTWCRREKKKRATVGLSGWWFAKLVHGCASIDQDCALTRGTLQYTNRKQKLAEAGQVWSSWALASAFSAAASTLYYTRHSSATVAWLPEI